MLMLVTNIDSKKEEDVPFSNSWGNFYTWHDCSLGRKEIIKISKELKKPVMWILFWTSCSACYHLQSTFKISNEIQRLSKNFMFVNCEGNDIPDDKDFILDGEYSPKIIFTDINGTVKSEIYNKHELAKSEYKYYYVDAGMLEESMRDAAILLHGEKAEL